ncbi:hypothetical protein [Parasedimentitalea psychrophila]|uniref:Uncharacterized protein n=1 Tax=Parasedimentitalea psychrophila TaxID=2997337 RepID=A0A9Y2P521_9RHOB|nr:hypothetical protein [Parasedimentitalea psychrophila]WIY27512.1 hypothetical protein QPJ95_11705 [Parasedimentitalea psychrophila]
MNDIINAARRIVGSPEDHLHDTSLFIAAWATMKAARGQGFDPQYLRPQHLIGCPSPAPEPIDQTLIRVGETVRSYAAKQGYRIQRRHAA